MYRPPIKLKSLFKCCFDYFNLLLYDMNCAFACPVCSRIELRWEHNGYREKVNIWLFFLKRKKLLIPLETERYVRNWRHRNELRISSFHVNCKGNLRFCNPTEHFSNTYASICVYAVKYHQKVYAYVLVALKSSHICSLQRLCQSCICFCICSRCRRSYLCPSA